MNVDNISGIGFLFLFLSNFHYILYCFDAYVITRENRIVFVLINLYCID